MRELFFITVHQMVAATKDVPEKKIRRTVAMNHVVSIDTNETTKETYLTLTGGEKFKINETEEFFKTSGAQYGVFRLLA